MLCSVNLSELGPEDVHCDLCVQIYSILLHISSLLSTASFLFTAHIVFTKSTPFMAIYRLYLLNCLCWGYLYSLLNSQIQFVILAPVIANYMKGQILPSIFRAIGLENYLLALTEVCFNNYIVGLLLLLLYRFVYFGPNSQSSTLGRALRSPMALLAIMSASTILGGLIDAIGLHLLTNDEDPRRLANRFPQLKSIFELHNAIGLSGLEDFKYLALLSSLSAASFLLGLILTNLGLHLKRCRNVRKLSSGNNSQTLRLMTQLYRMNTVQIILIGLLLTGPFLIGAGITAYKCHFSHHFWLLAIWLSSLHCSFDSMVILLYIRPYREYLHSTFIDSRWWRKNSVSTTTFVSQQQQMVPMTSLQLFSAGGMACSRINGGNGAEGEMPRVVCFSVESARRNTAPDQTN